MDFKRTDDIIYIILCRNRKRITIKLFFLLAVDNEKGISSDSDSGDFNANVNKVGYILKRFFKKMQSTRFKMHYEHIENWNILRIKVVKLLNDVFICRIFFNFAD